MSAREKIKSVMLGHAVADALGVPVEFRSRSELDENPLTDMRAYGTYNMPAGTWSDDTSMSLATLNSLASGEINYEEIMDNFVAWVLNAEYTATDVVFDIGTITFGVIRDYSTRERKEPLACGATDTYSNGNGSLMRIHPFALYLYYQGYGLDEALSIIHEASSMTHAHEISKVACGFYSLVLWELIRNPDISSVVRAIRTAREYYAESSAICYFDRVAKMAETFDPSHSDQNKIICYERDAIKSSGYVIDSLEAAIWCLLKTKDYKSCVLSAVNLGADTDTVAAIAGGLAGALYGYESIPNEWLDALKKRDYIEAMCDTAARRWTKN